MLHSSPHPLTSPKRSLWHQLQQEAQCFVAHDPEHAQKAQQLLCRGEVHHLTTPASTRWTPPLCNLEQGSAVPLSWLKLPQLHHRIWPTSAQSRSFLSSGTTVASSPSFSSYPYHNPQRSVSMFSRDGLFLYKISALKGFFQCLEKTPFALEEFQGISLIPSLQGWPHSSLAQMIAWFGEYFPLHYRQDMDSLQNYLKRMPPRPTWVFATAAHLLPACTKANTRPLGPWKDHLFVFETGGLKALAPHYESHQSLRKSLYTRLSENLDLPLHHIGGEYSSCELACQAWSFSAASEPSYAAPYYFPNHVHVDVQSPHHQTQPSTPSLRRGALIIYDPLRIDLPYALLSEDVVDLQEDGGFWPRSRVALSPPRGCSLRAVDHVTPTEALRSTADTMQHIKPSTNTKKHPLQIISGLRRLFTSRLWSEALRQELCDALISKQASEDLLHSLPEDPQAALLSSALPTSPTHQEATVMVIAPNNHSLACFYPIFLLLLGGYRVLVRVPLHFQGKHKPLMLYLRALSDMFCTEISVVGPWWRVTSAQDLSGLGISSLFFFGSHATFQSLSSHIPSHQLRGFAESWSLSLILPTDQEDLEKLLPLALRDAFALTGRGCLSSRMLCLPLSSYPQWRKLLPQQHTPQLSAEDHSTLMARHAALTSSQVALLPGGRSPFFFPFFLDPPLAKQVPLGPALRDFAQPFTHGFPSLFYSDLSELCCHLLRFHPHLKHISTPHPSVLKTLLAQQSIQRPCSISTLGALNKQPWNGLWEGGPLFTSACSRTARAKL